MVADLTQNLNRIFHERARMGIMSILAASLEEVEFTYLVNKLGLTRGNLSVHMKVLEENGYIVSEKKFVDKKPKTTYKITEEGRRAFAEYISLLEQIIKGITS